MATAAEIEALAKALREHRKRIDRLSLDSEELMEQIAELKTKSTEDPKKESVDDDGNPF
jgi:uncharacterized coiled-coil DUF342 family protein